MCLIALVWFQKELYWVRSGNGSSVASFTNVFCSVLFGLVWWFQFSFMICRIETDINPIVVKIYHVYAVTQGTFYHNIVM